MESMNDSKPCCPPGCAAGGVCFAGALGDFGSWLRGEGVRALSFGVLIANLGCFAPQQLRAQLLPQSGQPSSCLCRG